jgi:hypothetical protein
MSLKRFFARICQLLDSDYDLKSAEDNQEDNREELKAEDCQLLRIDNTDFFLMAHKTFFGLRFKYIFIKVDGPSSEKGYKLEPIFPNISPEQLKPFMIYPRIILQKRSMPLAEATISNIVNKLSFIEVFGPEVVGHPVEVICCILLELERLSGRRGICVNDCRYVLEAFGYELNSLGNQLAEIRILQEHGIGRGRP